jgi:hypothetical protein
MNERARACQPGSGPDEPSMGLAPMVAKTIFEIIQEINGQGVTELIVEQNASMALRLANRAYVLETGKITTSGSAQDLMSDELLAGKLPGPELAEYVVCSIVSAVPSTRPFRPARRAVRRGGWSAGRWRCTAWP